MVTRWKNVPETRKSTARDQSNNWTVVVNDWDHPTSRERADVKQLNFNPGWWRHLSGVNLDNLEDVWTSTRVGFFNQGLGFLTMVEFSSWLENSGSWKSTHLIFQVDPRRSGSSEYGQKPLTQAETRACPSVNSRSVDRTNLGLSCWITEADEKAHLLHPAGLCRLKPTLCPKLTDTSCFGP